MMRGPNTIYAGAKNPAAPLLTLEGIRRRRPRFVSAINIYGHQIFVRSDGLRDLLEPMRYLPFILLPLIACFSAARNEPQLIAPADETQGKEMNTEPRPALTSLPITAHLLGKLDYLYISVERLRQDPTLNELIDEFLDSLGSSDAELAPILRGLREGLVMLSVEEIIRGPGIYDRDGHAEVNGAPPNEIKRIVLYGDYSALERRERIADEFLVTHQTAEGLLLEHDGWLDPASRTMKLERAVEARVGISASLREELADAPEPLRALLNESDELRLAVDIGEPIIVAGSLRYHDASAAKGAVDALSFHLRQLELLALMLPPELRLIIQSALIRQDGVYASVELRIPQATFSSLGTLIEDIFMSLQD